MNNKSNMASFCKINFFVFTFLIASLTSPFVNISYGKEGTDILSQNFLSNPGVYNSEGFYSSSLNSVTVQSAINNLGSNSGTIWVNGDITLSSSIIPRRETILDFLGNEINVNENVPVISFAKGTFFAIIRETTINLPSGYNRAVFEFDNDGDPGWGDAMDFNNVENIIINGDSSTNYIGIKMRLDGRCEMWNNIFRNIKMYNPDTGILLEMTSNAVSDYDQVPGFSNGNAFDNILIDSFKHGINFIKPLDYIWGGFNRNYFKNIKFKYYEETENGITGVYANYNTFMGITMQNWDIYPSVEKVYQLDTDKVKIYTDIWDESNSKFEKPYGADVLETGCPATDFSISYNEFMIDVDYSKRGVHNSNDYFSDQATSSSIQEAINDLGSEGGTVVVNEPTTISSTIYMKSNVNVDFLSYNINMNSDIDAFIFPSGTKSASLKNIKADNYNYNGEYIIFDSTGDTQSDNIEYNHVENLIMTGDDFIGIHLKIDGLAGIWKNTFRDIYFWRGNGIHLEMTSNGIGYNRFGWANGNTFEHLLYDGFYQGIIFDIPSSISINDKAGFNCNLFKHVLYQIETGSEDGILGISGDTNTFMHVIYWDGDVSYYLQITSKAKNTKIWAHWRDDPKYFDDGINTVIETGQPVFDPSGFNWDIVNNPPNKPSTPSGETFGKLGTSYQYDTSAVDPDGDDVSYGWDWNGDNVVDEWSDFHPSGDTVSNPHKWTEKYTGEIKVKAKDSENNKGPWSDSLSISMPKNKAINFYSWFYIILQNHLHMFPILRFFLNLPILQ